MRPMLSAVLSVLLFTPSTLVLAQARPAAAPAATTPAALTAAQRDALARQDAQMADAARKVAELVDRGRSGEVWDGASEVARKLVSRPDFVRGIATDRARIGTLVSRGQPSVTRTQYPANAAVPQGMYINVNFPTRFSNTGQPVRELVSFRMEDDRVWRVSGYSVRGVGQ
jgi:hypothetical protein